MALTEETKRKISEALRGRKRSKEVTEKIRSKLIGRKHSIEARQKMSIAHLKRGVTQAQRDGRKKWRVKPRLSVEEREARQKAYRVVIGSLRRVLNYTGQKKTTRSFEILGYTHHELRSHLESLFKPGMTWENHGFGSDKWHVDHIRPVSSFPTNVPISEINALSNLQPLWQEENLRKKRKWTPE